MIRETERRRVHAAAGLMRFVFPVLVLLAALGCRRESPPEPAAKFLPESHAEFSRSVGTGDELLEYIELYTGGAKEEETLPMIIGVHGLGDTPEHFRALYEAFPLKSRVILPQGFIPWRGGYSWFDIDLPYSGRGERFSQDVVLAAERVATLVEYLHKTRPTEGSPIITGFSQGGMIAFTVAVTRPEVVALAIPIGGALPPGVTLVKRDDAPGIRALHGSGDSVIPVRFATESISRLKAKGWDASLVEYPGVPHTVTADIQRDLFRNIAERLKAR